MHATSLMDGIEASFDSLISGRLAILVGAGLSMAPPSNLPSAARIAVLAKQKYESIYGASRTPLPDGISEQADFFFARGELGTVYFTLLVDPNSFAAPPNPGHTAIADLQLVKLLDLAITTNIDTLIEHAGGTLYGQIFPCIDGAQLSTAPLGAASLLKIHGCIACDRDNTVWAAAQLTRPPISERIAKTRVALKDRLLNKDLLIVGYWTDWDYLNAVLDQTLGLVNPSKVIVVDLADASTFATKGPQLFGLGSRAKTSFIHVKASGADFLAQLRNRFSVSFVRQILHSGKAEFENLYTTIPNSAWLEPGPDDNDTYWAIRRDLEGCLPNKPALANRPPMNEPLMGLILLQLQAAGGVRNGRYWQLHGKKIRLLRTPNQALHRVISNFEREIAPAVAPDVIIAVGAEDCALPSHVARGSAAPTIARGTSGKWLTRPQALANLGIT
jgi:hypothetical protein